MSKKKNNYPEELVNLKGYFLDNYEEMNKFIRFFKKVQDYLVSNKNVKVKEINPPLNISEDSLILPFSFIIRINSKEFLFFFKNEENIELTKAEIEEYKDEFFNNPSQDGIIIVWNDDTLSSIKLNNVELYYPPEKLLEVIVDKYHDLKELIEAEIKLPKKFSEVLIAPIEDIKVMEPANFETRFHENLTDSFQYFKTRRLRDTRMEVMQGMEMNDLEQIPLLFSDFLTDKIDTTDLDNLIKKMKIYEEDIYD